MAPGLVFLPHDADARSACKAIVERIVNEEGQTLLGWREVPVNLEKIGKSCRVSRAGLRTGVYGRSA